MIYIDQAVKAKVLSLAGVAAVIGTDLYPDFIAQRVKKPAGTYSHAGIDRLEPLNGNQSKVKIDTFRLGLTSKRDIDVVAMRHAIDRNLSGIQAAGRWDDGANEGPVVVFVTIDDAATELEKDRVGGDESPRTTVCLLTVTWIDGEQP